MFLIALETFSLSYFSPVSSARLPAPPWGRSLCISALHRAAPVLDCLADMVARRRGGKFTITPLLLMWLTQPVLPVRSRHIFEAAGLLTAVVSTSALLFLNPVPAGLEYFALGPLLWAALRFGRRGAVTAAFVTSGIALWGTVRDLGPFAESEPHESIFLLQLFIATITMTALVVASVVSQQQRLEQRLRIKDAVSRILSEVSTITEAAPEIIKAICETAAWDFGALWLVDRSSNVLIVSTCGAYLLLMCRFAAVTREIKFAPGVGLPGRVWDSATPAWITDVLKDNNFFAPVAVSVGFHGAVGFPIKLDNEFFGVLELFSRETKERDHEFQEMVANLGTQLGQFVERQRAETALRSGSATSAGVVCRTDGRLGMEHKRAQDHLVLEFRGDPRPEARQLRRSLRGFEENHSPGRSSRLF